MSQRVSHFRWVQFNSIPFDLARTYNTLIYCIVYDITYHIHTEIKSRRSLLEKISHSAES